MVTNQKKLPQYLIDRLQKLKTEQANDHQNYVLELNNLDKIYDNGFQALFSVNIKLKQGEFLALLGPSGCGKSTTLRMIAGLEQVSFGDIYINKINVTNLEPADRSLTMVFQNYALFPHLTVKNNIAFGLRANKKKLGEGGKIYKEITYLKNQYKSSKILIDSIKQIESSQKKVDKLKTNLSQKKEKYNRFLKENKKTLLKKLKIQINTLEAVINHAQNKINYYLRMKNNLATISQNLVKLQEKINQLEIKRKEVAKNDKYDLIINQKVNQTAKILGLEYYLDRKPAALSGGQRQRVALGRSIVSSPFLFLMDEPLSNLDAKLRATMRKEIRFLHEKINTGTVYVTHDQIEAMTMADKIAVMTDGFVLQTGSPSEIYKNPSCIFVAGFVGSPAMNFLSGKIQQNAFVSDQGLVLQLTKEKLKHTQENQKVILGIRPNDFSTDDNLTDLYKPIKVKITNKELLGNEIQYTGLVQNNSSDHEEITFITNSYENYQLHTIKEIIPILSRIHLFDQTTTISLTSEFNYETLVALNNWIISDDKIKIRQELLEASKRKTQKKSWTSILISFLVKHSKKLFKK
ncbi:ABC transporter, ATP-binding protein [[Mycoplasma] cavipharyngis]|uniref:ABC transporter ATP-binding protein n=1 Tax=[Mycoplasma] cavipharyngis TaxID=92757 RepID=UPI0037044774